MMSPTCPSGFGPGRPGWVRQFAAAARIAAIWSRVSAFGWVFGWRNGEVPATGLRGTASCLRAKPEQQVEQGPRLAGPRGGDRGLRLEEPLDPARGDLRERVVLERRKHVQANLVAIVLPGPFSEPLEVEVGQPNLGQIREATLRRKDPGAAERGPMQQPFLEDQPCLRRGPCRHPDMPDPTVRVPYPGLSDHSVAPAAYRNRAVGTDRGPWPCHHGRLSW